jgi:seryl-tRNA synthetase
MLDIKYIRENPEVCVKRLQSKYRPGTYEWWHVDTLIEEIVRVDRWLRYDKESRDNYRYAAKIAGEHLKAEKRPPNAKERQELEDFKYLINGLEDSIKRLEEELQGYMFELPNLPHASVPLSKWE